MLVTPQSLTFSALHKPSGFIVMEGVNGAGKSTLIRLVEAFLTATGHPPRLTFEPGGTPAGEKIRELLLSPPGVSPGNKLDPLSEILLFAADRRENIMKVIWPALQAHTPVIGDRYIYSTLAFQGYGRGMDRAEIETIMHLATGGLRPDFVVLLDLDPHEGLRRAARRRSSEHDAFEQEELAFHSRLRTGFQTMARELPEPFIELDARRSSEELLADLTPALHTWLHALGQGSTGAA